MDAVWIYWLGINIIGFIVMGIDKAKAKANAWRISERMLFILAFMGGALGVWCGMYFFHHKTRHWYFKLGIPGILVLNVMFVLEFLF